MEDKSPKRGRKLTTKKDTLPQHKEWKISPRRGDGNLVLIRF